MQLTPLSVEAFRLALKSKGLKATTQRVAVHQAMMALGHACADQVSEWIEDKTNASVSTASVYNILSQMALLGIYSHRYSPDSKMYFDVNTGNHVSFTPLIIASFRSNPALRFCWIASLMTTALSTRIPRLTINAAIDIN